MKRDEFTFTITGKETADLITILVGVLTDQPLSDQAAYRVKAKQLAVKIVGQSSKKIAADVQALKAN